MSRALRYAYAPLTSPYAIIAARFDAATPLRYATLLLFCRDATLILIRYADMLLRR